MGAQEKRSDPDKEKRKIKAVNKMKEIMTVAKDHNLYVIEDAAHAPCSDYEGKSLGTIGDIGCFSFFSNKNISCAEGGALATGNYEYAKLARLLRSHGMTTLSYERAKGHATRYEVLELGFNYRIDEMSAALGVSQLSQIEDKVEARAAAAALYREALADIEGITLPPETFDGRMSWFVYVIRIDDGSPKAARDRILAGLRDRGIGCGDYFQPIHLQPFVRETLGTGPGGCPIAERIGDRTVALPFYVGLSESDVGRVTGALHEVLENVGGSR